MKLSTLFAIQLKFYSNISAWNCLSVKPWLSYIHIFLYYFFFFSQVSEYSKFWICANKYANYLMRIICIFRNFHFQRIQQFALLTIKCLLSIWLIWNSLSAHFRHGITANKKFCFNCATRFSKESCSYFPKLVLDKHDTRCTCSNNNK